MNMERAAMRGKLAEARERESRLALLIDGYCDAVRSGLNTALVPVADLDIPQVGVQWDALEAAWGELQGVRGEIARLEKGLS